MSNYYDKYKRNSKATAFYKSSQWIKLRSYIFNVRDTGLCQMCLDKGSVVTGDVVHHKVELLDGEKGWNLRLDANNLITICHDCHNKIHKSSKDNEPIREGFAFDEDGNLVQTEL